MSVYPLLTIYVLLFGVDKIVCKRNMSLEAYPGATNEEKIQNSLKCLKFLKSHAIPEISKNGGGLAANCLRYSFHDCGTYDRIKDPDGGCNGAIRTTISSAMKKLVYDTPQNPHSEDNGMRECQVYLTGEDGTSGLCDNLRVFHADVCGNISFADCINFVGYLSVFVTGGAPVEGCGWIPGRVDANKDKIQMTSLLPSETANATRMLKTFEAYEIPYQLYGIENLERAIVILSGAHTIGRSRVHPTNACSKGLGNMSNRPSTFDVDYFQGIVNNLGHVNDNNGWFCNDMHGLCNDIFYNTTMESTFNTLVVPTIEPTEALKESSARRRTSDASPGPHLERYGNDLNQAYCNQSDSLFAKYYIEYANVKNSKFFDDFCRAYQAISLIGYNIPNGLYLKYSSKFRDLFT